MEYLVLIGWGIIAGLLASIPLGPIGILCIQRTLSRDFFSGFVSGMGAALADTVFACLAIFALTYVTGFMDHYKMWVEIFGGLLVILLGCQIFFKKPRRPSADRSSGSGYLGKFFSVFALTIPNPAYFFVFVTIFAALGVGSIDGDVLSKWLIVFGVLLGASVWWFTLTWTISHLRHKFTMRSLLWLNKISGGGIILLGSYAILSVVYELVMKLDL